MEAQVAEGRMPTRGDRLFHVRIAAASDNSVLLRVVGELWDERGNPLFTQLGSHFETVSSWSLAIAEHRAVVDAIANGDAEAARGAMSTHLARSHDRFTASWTADGAAATKSARRAGARETA